MSKIETLSPINASYTGISKLNGHLEKVTTAFQNTLSRDGSTPNAMEADIDMNDNQLLNVGDPLLDGNAATKRYVDNIAFGDNLGAILAASGDVRRVSNYAELTALTAANGRINEGVYAVVGRLTAGDGGEGVWRYSSSSVVAANGGTVLAANDGVGRYLRIFDGANFDVRWFGVIADDATNNTSALNSAFAAAAGKTAIMPIGVVRAGVIAPSASLTIEGRDKYLSVLKRNASSNNFCLTFTNLANVKIKNLTIDANLAQNTGNGAHGGLTFTNCENPVLEDVRCLDWRGTFSGSPVGSGVYITGSTGARLTGVYIENSYDGLIINQHDYFWTDQCRFVSCVRFGALYDACDDWVDNNSFAVLCGSSDVTLDAACAGMAVQNCDRWVSNSPQCNNSTYGYGFQIQIGCDNWVLNSPRVLNNGWDGVGITAGVTVNYCYRGRVVGGYGFNNRASNLAVNDGSGDITVLGFVDGGGSLQGINVFRSSARLVGCYGQVTVWDAGVVNTLAIGAAGAGYTNGTYTAVPLVGPTWYTDALGRSSLTANITVAGGVVTVATINFIGNMALPPTSLTGLTAPTLPGGAGALFTITLIGASSNTCQNTTISDGHQGGTLLVQAGAVTYLPVKSCGFTTITDPGYAVSGTAIPASLQNSWVVQTRCVYYKDVDGIVHVEGRIQNGTVAANTLIFVLPVGFRPANSERFVIEANGVFGRVYVEPDGDVRDLGGSFSAAGTTLNHIKFRAV
jgi:hypothetical protein